jgi:hypothetical protein
MGDHIACRWIDRVENLRDKACCAPIRGDSWCFGGQGRSVCVGYLQGVDIDLFQSGAADRISHGGSTPVMQHTGRCQRCPSGRVQNVRCMVSPARIRIPRLGAESRLDGFVAYVCQRTERTRIEEYVHSINQE